MNEQYETNDNFMCASKNQQSKWESNRSSVIFFILCLWVWSPFFPSGLRWVRVSLFFHYSSKVRQNTGSMVGGRGGGKGRGREKWQKDICTNIISLLYEKLLFLLLFLILEVGLGFGGIFWFVSFLYQWMDGWMDGGRGNRGRGLHWMHN